MILTIDNLKRESVVFSNLEKNYNNPLLYGTTDGKKYQQILNIDLNIIYYNQDMNLILEIHLKV